mgnify:CR=1 FL=1
MRTNPYNQMVRDFVEMADAVNRRMSTAPYDYARNGGHDGEGLAHVLRRYPILYQHQARQDVG